MARLIVHCGLHKTGTTALQDFLAAQADALRARGVLYPKTGRPAGLNGHHNLSWQLSRDRRYDPRYGTLDTLLAEIAGFDGTVVVSSEDFESLLADPRHFSPLTTRAAAAGWQVELVVYLRDPLRYLESVYLEHIKHGCGDEFYAVRHEAIVSGRWRFNEWECHFDYAQLMQRWTAAGLPAVRWCSYDRLSGASVIDDFMRIPGIGLPATDAAQRSNKRAGWAPSLLAFATARSLTHSRQVTDKQLRQAVQFLAEDQDPDLSVGIVDANTLLSAGPFAASRSVLDRLSTNTSSEIAAKEPDNGRTRSEPACALSIERVFSFESFVMLQMIAMFIGNPRHDAVLKTLKQDWHRLARMGVRV